MDVIKLADIKLYNCYFSDNLGNLDIINIRNQSVVNTTGLWR